MMFFGDLALHRDTTKYFQHKESNLFGNLPDLFKKADIVIGNLESPLPGDGNENLLKHPRVIGDPDIFHYITLLRPDILSLANNHVYDALNVGFCNTINFLNKHGVNYLGAALTQQEEKKPILIECDGLKIGFLSYVSYDTNPSLPPNAHVFLNYFDLSTAVKDILKLKSEAGICVVLLHWGVDYCHFYSPNQREIVLSLIDAGADLIVGTHAHVIQPVERIKGCLVAYGLGNFYFPDIIMKDYKRIWNKENRKSLVFDVIINKQGISSVKYHRTFQNGDNVNLQSAGIRRYIWKLNFLNTFLRWNLAWKTYLIYRHRKELVYRYLFKRDKGAFRQIMGLRPRHVKRLFSP